MSQPLVRPSDTLSLPRWRRLSTLTVEQILISASGYAVSWTFVHAAPAKLLPGFYIAWIWGWGLFVVLSQLVLTPARLMRADDELPEDVLNAAVLTAGTGAGVAVTVAVMASLVGADMAASVAEAAGLGLAALAFFTRRVQADGNPLGLVPRAASYLLLTGVGLLALGRTGLLDQLTAIGWACVSLIAAAVWGARGRPYQAAAATVSLLRRVWPQGRWYALATITRTLLYSSGLVTLIRMERGAGETAVLAAVLVLTGPLTLIGTVLPWAHLPELRSALDDRAAFVRVWARQLMQYFGILAVALTVLSAAWRPWVRLSVADVGLAGAVSAQRPIVLTLVAAVVLTSWTGAALMALDKAKHTFVIVCVSGVAALASVPLGVPAGICVTIPYVITVGLALGEALRALRLPGERLR